MKLKIIAFLILSIFGLMGLMLGGTLLHEYSHYRDYKDVEVFNEEICLYAFEPNQTFSSAVWSVRGYYSFQHRADDETLEQIGEVKEYTEMKATSIDLFLTLLYSLSVFIIIIDIIDSVLEERKLKGGNN